MGRVALLLLFMCGGGSLGWQTAATTTVTLGAHPASGHVSSTPSPKSPGPDQPYLGSLTFDWPVGCAVPVREQVTKRDEHVQLSYLVRTQAAQPGIEVSIDEIRFDEYNGVEVPAVVARRLTVEFMLPRILVGPDGVEQRVVGMDALIDEMEDAGLLEADFFTPQMIALVEETVLAKYWGSWVGFWAGLGTVDEQLLVGELPMALGESTFAIDVVVESLPPTAPGTATFRFVQTLAGDDLRASLGIVLGAAGNDTSAADMASVDGHRITTTEITTDPSTLRPSSVSWTNDIELTEDGRTETEVEVREWQFDWASLQCDQ